MANDLEPTEISAIRRHAGYGEPFGDTPLSLSAEYLEERLEAMPQEQADMLRQTFLAPLEDMFAAYVASYSQMSIASAGEGAFERNANQLNERRQLMTDLRRAMCGFIGIPLGPLHLDPTSFLIAKAVR